MAIQLTQKTCYRVRYYTGRVITTNFVKGGRQIRKEVRELDFDDESQLDEFISFLSICHKDLIGIEEYKLDEWF